MSRSNLFGLLAAAVTMSGVLSPAHPADLLISSSNTNQVLRYNGTTGVPISAFVPAGSGGLTTPFERVPTGDFEGDPRPDLPDLPAIGFDEGP
jgi:hypothetical protein